MLVVKVCHNVPRIVQIVGISLVETNVYNVQWDLKNVHLLHFLLLVLLVIIWHKEVYVLHVLKDNNLAKPVLFRQLVAMVFI